MQAPGRSLSPLLVAISLCLCPAASAVTIDWVTVGDPGNVCDPLVSGCLGSVAQTYRISKHEVTNAQYAEFLNAVADADPNALYNTLMGSTNGGIARSGSDGSYTYSTVAGREDWPVNYVSFNDAMRFANWLGNGQSIGAQDATTTEDGAYTITPLGLADNSITRNPGAAIVLPSQDEWHKAAFYDALSTSYFDYEAGSDAQMTCASPGATANTANCNNVHGALTPVGSYTGAASPYGTFDQGGNVLEWTDTIDGTGTQRYAHGGSFLTLPEGLSAESSYVGGPGFSGLALGFRVASLPEPGSGLLLIAGLAACVACRRRA